jgi:hypothetical protein
MKTKMWVSNLPTFDNIIDIDDLHLWWNHLCWQIASLWHTVMGIKLLLPSLAATRQTDFIKMAKKTLKMNGKVIGFDAAGLLFICAQTHPDNCMCGDCGNCGNCGNYSKPLRQSSQQIVIYLYKICNLGSKLFLVFDGCNSKWKANEQTRPARKCWNNPLFIAMAKKIWDWMFITLIIASEEANSQLAYHPTSWSTPGSQSIPWDSWGNLETQEIQHGSLMGWW